MSRRSEMSGENERERARNAFEVERRDEQAPVAELAPTARPHESAKLRVDGSTALSRLLLELPERPKLSLLGDDLLNASSPE